MKRILSAALILALLVALSGCGGGKEPEAEGFKPALDTKASADIVVMGSYSNFESLEAIFEDFNRYYPNVSLQYVKPDDYNNTIGTILDGADAPNIYFTYNWMRGRELFEACFRHAEDLSDPALGLDLSCLRQNLLNRDESGALPMIPVFATTYGALINDDLFKKEGLKPPTTYSELLEVCEQLRQKGYESPMMGYFPDSPANAFMYALIYPYYCGLIAGDSEAVAAANALSPEAGESMRAPLARMMELVEQGCIDLTACAALEDGYTALILRFFEGDVPMMICAGDTVSGTKKRESQSEAFTKKPFSYSFAAIPLADEGPYLVDTASFQFSVNRDCDDLAMTNEFMRFLVTPQEMNRMAEIKRLVTPTTDLTYDNIYAPLGSVPADRMVSPEKIPLTDDVTLQLRSAAFQVITGAATIDEVVSRYGSLE